MLPAGPEAQKSEYVHHYDIQFTSNSVVLEEYSTMRNASDNLRTQGPGHHWESVLVKVRLNPHSANFERSITLASLQ